MSQSTLIKSWNFKKDQQPVEILLFAKRTMLFYRFEMEIVDHTHNNQRKLYYQIPGYCYCLRQNESKLNGPNTENPFQQIEEKWSQIFNMNYLPTVWSGNYSIEPYASAFCNRQELKVDAEIAFRIIHFIRSYKITEQNNKTFSSQIIDYINSIPVGSQHIGRKQVFVSMFSLEENSSFEFDQKVYSSSITGPALIDGVVAYFPTQTTIDIFQSVISLKYKQTNIFGATKSGKTLSLCLLCQLCNFIEIYREKIYNNWQNQQEDELLKNMATIPKLFYFTHDWHSNFRNFFSILRSQMPYEMKTQHSFSEDYLTRIEQFYAKHNINVVYIMDNCHIVQRTLEKYHNNYEKSLFVSQIIAFRKTLDVLGKCRVFYLSQEQITIEKQNLTFFYETVSRFIEPIDLTREKGLTQGEVRRLVQLLQFQHVKCIKKHLGTRQRIGLGQRPKDKILIVKQLKLANTVQKEYDSFMKLYNFTCYLKKYPLVCQKPHNFFRHFFKEEYQLSKPISAQLDENNKMDIESLGFARLFRQMEYYDNKLRKRQSTEYQMQASILQEYSVLGLQFTPEYLSFE